MRVSLLAVPAAILCLALFTAGPVLTQQEEGIDWLDNYAKAREEAKRTGKPIFLEFRCEA